MLCTNFSVGRAMCLTKPAIAGLTSFGNFNFLSQLLKNEPIDTRCTGTRTIPHREMVEGEAYVKSDVSKMIRKDSGIC